MIGKALKILQARGIAGLMYAANSRLHGLLEKPAKSFGTYGLPLSGKTGIEIGGPSQVFTKNGIFPVYPIVGKLDNCNFGSSTVWEGNIRSGKTYHFDRSKATGHQHIAETTALNTLDSATYDFVLSSHVLEHVANPILAISEWVRVLKDQGTLVLLLPCKDKTFDHRRPVTHLEHLIADFQENILEDDMTHLPEILALHDLRRDPEAGDFEAFKSRSLNNQENRCLHHHVFDMQLAVNLLEYMGLKVEATEILQPHHLLLVAKKPKHPKTSTNTPKPVSSP